MTPEFRISVSHLDSDDTAGVFSAVDIGISGGDSRPQSFAQAKLAHWSHAAPALALVLW